MKMEMMSYVVSYRIVIKHAVMIMMKKKHFALPTVLNKSFQTAWLALVN